MYERRQIRVYRRGNRKIYYPLPKRAPRRPPEAHPSRPSRFRSRALEDGLNSAESREKPSLFKLFRPRTEKNRQKPNSTPAEKRFRAHKSRKRSYPSPPPPKAAAQPAPPATQERPEPVPVPEHSYQPVYPYYPAPPAFIPVYPPPPPPSYGFALCDENGRRLSDRELDELNAREDYEDRYGRDFDRYADSSPAAAPSKGVFPKNYLVDAEDE